MQYQGIPWEFHSHRMSNVYVPRLDLILVGLMQNGRIFAYSFFRIQVIL